jgi:hypothetical protein
MEPSLNWHREAIYNSSGYVTAVALRNKAINNSFNPTHPTSSQPLFLPSFSPTLPQDLLQTLQAALPEFNSNRSQYLDSLTSKGQTPLTLAAANGHYTCAQLLLEWGAGINSPNAEGNTPLHAATSSRQSHIIDLLLTRDADPFITNARGFTCMDLAASLGNHTLLRRFENKAICNGWLMMKVPRFAGLGCEWQPRFTVVTRRTTSPQPSGTANSNAATHHFVLLAYKAEADVTPSCKVWLDGAVCRDNPNPRATERLNGAFEPAEVVVRLSSRHKKPEGACPRQDSGKTRYLLFFRPLEGTTASVSALRRFMNGVNTRQREDAPQPPSISSLASSDEEVARRLQEEEDARMARAIANNNREEGGFASSPTGNHNYSNNHQNLHQPVAGSLGGYPQVIYGDGAPVSLSLVFFFGGSFCFWFLVPSFFFFLLDIDCPNSHSFLPLNYKNSG